MKATELRIGNWFEIQGLESKIISVDTEGCICENEYCEDFENNNITQNLQPIPLTEEWLERFNWNPPKDIGVAFSLTTDEIHFVAGNYYKKIEYVHQLQNLYFALIGEELTENDK